MIRKRSLGLRVRQRYEKTGYSCFKEAFETEPETMYDFNTQLDFIPKMKFETQFGTPKMEKI